MSEPTSALAIGDILDRTAAAGASAPLEIAASVVWPSMHSVTQNGDSVSDINSATRFQPKIDVGVNTEILSKKTVLFGSSMTKFVNQKRLGSEQREFINFSRIGARLLPLPRRDSHQPSVYQTMLENFIALNSTIVQEVNTLFLQWEQMAFNFIVTILGGQVSYMFSCIHLRNLFRHVGNTLASLL